MTSEAVTPHGVHEPMRPGSLGAWWQQGARSAVFLRPHWHHLQATPATVAWLVIVPLALGVLVERAYIDGPAGFYGPAVLSGWLTTLITAWACWLSTPPTAPAQDGGGPPPPSASALFAMLAAQVLVIGVVLSAVTVPLWRSGLISQDDPPEWARWVFWFLPLLWVGAGHATLLWRSSRALWRAKLLACSMLLIVMVAARWNEPVRFWYPEMPPRADRSTRPPHLTQELIEAQAPLLEERLDALLPTARGAVRVYAITFAPYAEENVFRNESRLVASVMQERFGAEGRTIELVNHRDTVSEQPWATPLNLQRAIARIGQLMDRDQDVLFIHLTSHGARSGELSASRWPLEAQRVDARLLRTWLDEAGIRYRVVSVSACHSGTWIEPLSGTDTLVMTASDVEHTSYGCGQDSPMTFFGRAVFDEQLRQTWSFEAAHARARTVIEQREQEAGKRDGFSNPQLAAGEGIRTQLARLEAERAATGR
jgi:hypothetical protein